MTFRARLSTTFVLAVLVPVVAFGALVGNEMTRRLAAQYERRVDALAGVISDDLARRGQSIASSLAAITSAAADDNRLRAAAIDGGEANRRYLLDYASRAMRLAGLDMLQIQDANGRIISSGHFRNEYGRLEPALPRLLGEVPGGTALVEARAPDGPFLGLARADTLWMGGRRFSIVAGVAVGARFLARLEPDGDVAVTLQLPDSVAVAAGNGGIERDLDVPFIGLDRAGVGTAVFRVSHDLAGLRALRAGVTRWFVVVLLITAVIAAALVWWLSLRLSRPLAALADKTARVDLDRLDVDFDTTRRDEIGALSRLLAAMTDRLRASAARVRDAERRAAMGELARQVNHDIKNGLTPIRNVLRHLFQLAGDDPTSVAGVLRERQGTLESSVTYLENLAASYARLSPRAERRPCPVDDVVRGVVADRRGQPGVDVRADVHSGSAVLADPLWLRRILENLVDNAADSVGDDGGTVTVSTALEDDAVRIDVSDTGEGMDEDTVAKVFDDFYTTKETGTGLGLSIVRRLVMDLDGSMGVESRKGAGSRFTVRLPRVSEAKKG